MFSFISIYKQLVGSLSILQDIHRINVDNLYKLVTKEDGHYFHVHKLLGISCLVHYMYRFYLVATCHSMMFRADWTTVMCIALHMSLNATSFFFKISGFRIKSAPMIYPEMRWHSLIFAYRSLVTMGLMWVSRHYGWISPLYLRSGAVLLTLYFADKTTEYYPQQGTTMRVMPKPDYFTPTFSLCLNRFYTFSQIVATVQILFSHNMDAVFLVVFPIQMAVFLMTLTRKGILSAGGWHYLYTLSLITGFVSNMYIRDTGTNEFTEGFIVPCGVFVYVMRMYFSQVSKYYVWAFVCGVQLYAMVFLRRYLVIHE